jgi:glycosyltransferase 2 family protein
MRSVIRTRRRDAPPGVEDGSRTESNIPLAVQIWLPTRKDHRLNRLRYLATPVALACLGLLVWWLEPQEILAALSNVSFLHVLLGLLLVQGQIVLSGLRWRFTAARLGQTMPISHAIGEYYVASAVNQVAPGGMAGDVLRAYRSADGEAGGWQRSAKAVFFERLSGQLAFVFLCLPGLVFWPLLIGESLWSTEGLVVAAFVFAGLAAAVTLAMRRFQNLRGDFAEVFLRRGAFAIQGGLSLAVVLGYGALFLVAADAVGKPLPLVGAFTVVPLCLAAMLIPTGLGGWGTREAAAAALWPLIGLASADGVSASLVYGALAMAGAAPGFLVIAFSQKRRTAG